MEHLIEHLKSANENRKRLKSEIKDIRPLVFLYKDKEATGLLLVGLAVFAHCYNFLNW